MGSSGMLPSRPPESSRRRSLSELICAFFSLILYANLFGGIELVLTLMLMGRWSLPQVSWSVATLHRLASSRDANTRSIVELLLCGVEILVGVSSFNSTMSVSSDAESKSSPTLSVWWLFHSVWCALKSPRTMRFLYLSCRLKILWRSFLGVCWPGCLYKLMMVMFWGLHVTVMPPSSIDAWEMWEMLILLKHIVSRIKNEVPLKPWETYVISAEPFDFEVVILGEKCFLKTDYVIWHRKPLQIR